MIQWPRARAVVRLPPTALCLVTCTASCFLSACVPDSQVSQIQQLQDEVAAQRRELEARDVTLRDQAAQIRKLMTISDDVRLDWISHVERVDFASLSGGFDVNNDSIDDGIVIYLQPVDQDGHVIKAAGSVDVRLFDLANPSDQQEVGRLDLDVPSTRKTWFGSLAYHYTIRIPWHQGLSRAPHSTITADVGFTEYLTGKTFRKQAPFVVRGASK